MPVLEAARDVAGVCGVPELASLADRLDVVVGQLLGVLPPLPSPVAGASTPVGTVDLELVTATAADEAALPRWTPAGWTSPLVRCRE